MNAPLARLSARLLPLLLGIGACATPSTGSSPRAEDEAAVLQVVQELFDAMEHRDVELGAGSVVPEGVFVSVRSSPEGRVVRSSSNAEWLAELPQQTLAMREVLTGEPTVLVEGDVAVVWAEYAFELEGRLNHTGVDAFTLVRTDDGWRIAGGAYTVILAPR